MQMAQQPGTSEDLQMIKQLYSVMNSILHIVESVIS
jgi:hypothetical protein